MIKKMMTVVLAVTVTTGFAQKPAGTGATGMKASMEAGKMVYMQRCLTCHQKDGGGVPHLNAPLDAATAIVAPDKQKLIRILLKGMFDRVEIDGEYYSNNMPAHSDLKDQQIADVLTYIRNNWSNKASAVSMAEVKAVRSKVK